MKKRVLVIGGYGNFGRLISKQLAVEAGVELIVGGRSLDKAQAFCANLRADDTPQAIAFDAGADVQMVLREVDPDIVINTCGPFQQKNYHVAISCIAHGCHYIDLADGREFVSSIVSLHQMAKEKGVHVISGASSVPCFTSALIDHYKGRFSSLTDVEYGITTAQKSQRGLATVKAILSYTGKPFLALRKGRFKPIYGWQNLHKHKYRLTRPKLLCSCDVPDLALFPARYPTLQSQRFYAGVELPLLQIGLWLLSWLVRLRIVKSLVPFAPMLLKVSNLFDAFGTEDSSFFMTLNGVNNIGNSETITFELLARSGDGSSIPCLPPVLLARKIISGELGENGAMPCVGLISLGEYLAALSGLDVTWDEWSSEEAPRSL